MSTPESQPPDSEPAGATNPYTPPQSQDDSGQTTGTDSQAPPSARFWASTVLLLPFVLSQAFFWAGFGFGRITIRNDQYSIGSSFWGLGFCAAGGFVYGVAITAYVWRRWRGRFARPLIMLAVLEACLFPILATGGCIGFAFLVNGL